MITFANEQSIRLVKSMWKDCFEDTDEDMNLFFSEKYKEQNTLIYWEDNTAVASLQMLVYDIRFYNQVMPFYYLAGLCTLPKYRNKGYMNKLIHKSFDVMRERKIPISILIPAEEWLYGYYNKFSFEETFGKGDNPINLAPILKDSDSSFKEAYRMFDIKYQQSDFCILKNYEDFKTVAKEYIMDGYPIKYNLRGMSAIIDPLATLKAYANSKPEIEFSLHVTDNNKSYLIKAGTAIELKKDELADKPTFEVSINMLSRLLFGFNIDKLPTEYQSKFDEHYPIMNLMME